MKCDHCGEGEIELVRGNEPWTPDYWMCTTCNATSGVFGGVGGKAITPRLSLRVQCPARPFNKESRYLSKGRLA
jgi:hypothetical protein